MADGWHFEHIPFGHGKCPAQPSFIRQLIFSNSKNFPLKV